MFVVIGGRESSGFGLEDALHSAWPQLVFRRQFPDGTVYVNLARNDTTAAQARADQTPVAVEQHPTVAVVWLGEGDDIVGTRPAQFGQDLELLLSRLRQSGTGRVLVASPPSECSWIPVRSADRIGRPKQQEPRSSGCRPVLGIRTRHDRNERPSKPPRRTSSAEPSKR